MERNQARVQPVSQDKFSKELKEAIEKIPAFKEKKSNANAIGMLAHGGPLATYFLQYIAKASSKYQLSPRHIAILNLRAAVKRGSDYVWGINLPLAKEALLTEADIQQIAKNGLKLTQMEQSLIAAVDEILDTSDISESLWGLLNTHFTLEQIVEIFLITSQCLFFILLHNAFGTQLDMDLMPIPESIALVTPKPPEELQ